MNRRRTRRLAAIIAFAGATSVFHAAPASAEPSFCGYVKIGGVDLWSEPCVPGCDVALVDEGTNPETDWTYLCLQG